MNKRVKIRIKNTSGILQNKAPISIKGALKSSVKKLEDIGDVQSIDLVDGATLVYNQTSAKYEIKKLDADDLDGDIDLDYGEY